MKNLLNILILSFIGLTALFSQSKSIYVDCVCEIEYDAKGDSYIGTPYEGIKIYRYEDGQKTDLLMNYEGVKFTDLSFTEELFIIDGDRYTKTRIVNYTSDSEIAACLKSGGGSGGVIVEDCNECPPNEPGPAGANGEQGPQGEQGPKGDDGADGVNPDPADIDWADIDTTGLKTFVKDCVGDVSGGEADGVTTDFFFDDADSTLTVEVTAPNGAITELDVDFSELLSGIAGGSCDCISVNELTNANGLDSIELIVDGTTYTHNDTDTYGTPLDATATGTDFFGNDFEAGDNLITFPDPNGGPDLIVCIPEKVDPVLQVQPTGYCYGGGEADPVLQVQPTGYCTN